jgi:hypothetical protein
VAGSAVLLAIVGNAVTVRKILPLRSEMTAACAVHGVQFLPKKRLWRVGTSQLVGCICITEAALATAGTIARDGSARLVKQTDFDAGVVQIPTEGRNDRGPGSEARI